MKHRGGFILVLVLWVLLALSIAASALAAWISRTNEQAVMLVDEREGQLDAFETFETLKFLLATRPMRVGGLYLGNDPHGMARGWRNDPFSSRQSASDSGDLALDGRLWLGLGSTHFSLQDHNGLLGIHKIDDPRLVPLIRHHVAGVQRPSVLFERIGEYVNWQAAPVRDAEYRANVLALPPGRRLLTPMEAHRVLGWQDQSTLWQNREWAGLFTALRAGSLNINTAPPELLSALPAISAERSRLVATARRSKPFSSLVQPARILGTHLDAMGWTVIPADTQRLTLGASRSERNWQYNIKLASNEAPWLIQSAFPATRSEGQEDSGQIPQHALFAESKDSRPEAER